MSKSKGESPDLFPEFYQFPDLSKGASREEKALDELPPEEQEQNRKRSLGEQLELAEKVQDIEDRKQDRGEREKYASRVYWLIVCWLIALAGILLLQGFENSFSLRENVVLALIGGTTANVLGIFIVVINYLFPKD